jgi:hypothetical protein
VKMPPPHGTFRAAPRAKSDAGAEQHGLELE